MEQQQTTSGAEIIPTVGSIVRFKGYTELQVDPDTGKPMVPTFEEGETLKILKIDRDETGHTTLEARPCAADGSITDDGRGDTLFTDEVEVGEAPAITKAEKAKAARAAKAKAKRAAAKAVKEADEAEAKAADEPATVAKAKTNGKADGGSDEVSDEADAIEEAEAMAGAATEVRDTYTTVTSPEGFTHDHEVMLAAGNDVVAAAKALANKDEEINYVLGGLLAKIKDDRLHIEAGYPDTHIGFSDFVQDQVGVGKRKAQYLRNIYVVFRQVGLDKSVLADIGWTKAKELTRLSLEDLHDADWAEIARNSNARDLAETVTTRLNAQKGTQTVLKKTFSFALTGDTIGIADRAIARAESNIEAGDDPKAIRNEAFEAICVFYNNGIEQSEAGVVLPQNRQQLEDLAASIGLDITINGPIESMAADEDPRRVTQ